MGKSPAQALRRPFRLLATAALLIAVPFALTGVAHASHVALTLVSESSTPGTAANANSPPYAISGDGNTILLQSSATNLVAGQTDSNSGDDIFLYDVPAGVTMLVSAKADSTTTTAEFPSYTSSFMMSADGTRVLFTSGVTDLVSGVTDTNSNYDLFLWDSGVVKLISQSATDASHTANGGVAEAVSSADGSIIYYSTTSTNVVTGITDSNSKLDIYKCRGDRRNDPGDRVVGHCQPDCQLQCLQFSPQSVLLRRRQPSRLSSLCLRRPGGRYRRQLEP